MRHVALIVNPFASAVDEHRIKLVEQTLSGKVEVETYLTERRGHATELARLTSGSAEAIFVYSGDGGFNEVANGVGVDGPPVGCIPGGGTSVFPRLLGIPRDPLRAAEHLADAFEQRRTRTVSVGRVNGRRFLFNAGVFFDAELVRRIEAKRSQAGRPGDAAFAATVLKLIAEHRGRFDPVLEIEGLGRAAFLLVANADPYTYLGTVPVHVAPQATLEGGLDAIALTRGRLRHIPRLMRYVLTGGDLPKAVLMVRDADRLAVRCDRPLPLQADGEDLGDVTEAEFEAERGVLTVLA
jgi:diacylglycerol kinase family enzyme